MASISQIILKFGSGKKYSSFIREYLNPYFIGGNIVMVISMLLKIFAYNFTAYENGPIIDSLGFVFVMILSALFFKEKITKKKVIGNIFIILGIIIFYL